MRTAVIDIGSNSVLLLVAERVAGNWLVLSDQTVITRLGEGFEPDRTLKPKAVRRTLTAIDKYLQQCRAMGVARIVAVATAVVRRAVNPEALLQPMQERGCGVWVLSEREEAELSFLAVALDPAMRTPAPLSNEETLEDMARRLFKPQPQTNGGPHCSLPERDYIALRKAEISTNGEQGNESAGQPSASWLVIDIGGGSVECAYGAPSMDTSGLRWRSLPVGAMVLREQLAPSNPPNPDEIATVRRWLDKQFRFLSLLPPPEQMVAVGGTGVNLAMLWCGLHGTPATVEEVHGFRLTEGMLNEMVNLLLSLGDSERAHLPGIERERAPVLHLGALILQRALLATQQSSVRISTYGLRYGALWRLTRSE